MTRQANHLAVKVLTGVLAALFLAVNGFSLIMANGAGSGYGDAGGGERAAATSLEPGIVAAAGHFLQGCSGVQTLLSGVEQGGAAGMDFIALQQAAAGALNHIRQAGTVYRRILAMAEAAPYRPGVRARLLGFDYRAFMVKHRLNRTVFNRVAAHLSRGDITGIFKMTFTRLQEIESVLTRIHLDLCAYREPVLTDCWQLNELCAQAALLGSYTARIFHALKEK
jgi:hypothetical protein